MSCNIKGLHDVVPLVAVLLFQPTVYKFPPYPNGANLRPSLSARIGLLKIKPRILFDQAEVYIPMVGRAILGSKMVAEGVVDLPFFSLPPES